MTEASTSQVPRPVVLMITVVARAERDDQVDADHIREAGHDAGHQPALVFQPMRPISRPMSRNQVGGVIEPPVAKAVAGEPVGEAQGVVDALVQGAPGDEAQDHDHEGQAEDHEHALLAAGELDAGVDLGGSAVSFFALVQLVGGQDGALALLDLLGVTGNEQCGDEVGGQPQG